MVGRQLDFARCSKAIKLRLLSECSSGDKMDADVIDTQTQLPAGEMPGGKASQQDAVPRWTAALPIIVLVGFLAVLLVHLTGGGERYLSFFVDDFFYYLVIARNLAFHGASTFNGLQATNGYHPLWLLTIAFLYRLFGTHFAFFVALLVLIWLLVCGSYRALLAAQLSLGIAPIPGLACALFSVTFMAVLARTGMEVGLALFFLCLFWERMAARPLEVQTSAEALVSGLLASALVLSRIDASLIVVLYGGLTLIKPFGVRRSRVLKTMLWFGAGLVPIAIYVAINQLEFGTILPISGIAKNLKSTWFPSASAVRAFGLLRGINILFTWPSFVLCALFLVHLLSRPKGADSAVQPGGRRLQLCVVLHPIIFYSVLSFSSDWPMFWIWYLYPLVPVCALVGPTLIARWVPISRGAMLWLAAAVTCGSLMVILDRVEPHKLAMFSLQRDIGLREFAMAHPGRYGIGDVAGLAGYLMPPPVLQLEGLVADKPFLERIRHQQPLLQALDELGVDYYVTFRARRSADCWDVREPDEAGPHSPVMRAHLCIQPVADIGPTGDPHHALVFDMRQLRRAGATAGSTPPPISGSISP
jgi:hypothetical protein